jgi:hypothetical protein
MPTTVHLGRGRKEFQLTITIHRSPETSDSNATGQYFGNIFRCARGRIVVPLKRIESRAELRTLPEPTVLLHFRTIHF